jgi:hypothetical protein
MKTIYTILSQKITKLLRKIITFSKSLLFHIYSGFPKSSQDQINYRFNICNSCEYYDPQLKQCMVCGCNVSTKKRFMNKLAWADQKCPMDKWKEVI